MSRLIVMSLALMTLFAPLARADNAVTTQFSAHTAGSKAAIDHSVWTAVISAHVIVGADGVNRLPYARLKGEPAAAIKRYIRAMETVPIASYDRAEQQAFWVNLYNAVTLDVVLGHYPVTSINDVNLKDAKGVLQDGPWKAKLVTVSGALLSLDDIENAIVRPIYKDARAHYVLNCLSIGCPNLQPVALTGANLERIYEEASRAFVNHPRAIAFGDDGKVTASSVYDWFADDFGGFPGIVAHLQRYAAPALAARLAGLKSIDAYAYDWALADAPQ